MTRKLDLHPSDLVGFNRLANSAVAGVTDVVEALHGEIARTSGGVGTSPAQQLSAGISALVYKSIRGVTYLIGGSLIAAEPLLPPAPERVSLRREAIVAAVNGVLGDYLVRTRNPLALSMSLRRRGRSLVIEKHALQKAIAQPTGKVLLLAHGLCLNDLQWKRNGHNYGASLARDLGYTPIYLHYNSGLHVSDNGRSLAALLESLLDQWPVPVQELAIIGHSMGGLVARSAHHYATEAGHLWPRHLRTLIFLGTPHHGAPLERLGNWVDAALQLNPYTLPFANLGKIRSAGITDMRYGNLVEQDWQGRDRFASRADTRRPLPLPRDVECYAIAATRQPHASSGPDLLGDGLVTLDSALGRHPNPEMSLNFAESHQWTAFGANHWDLLSHPAVYENLCQWLQSSNQPESSSQTEVVFP
jgi:pimeloyl-ACP methyl ester carboxylesterase